MFGVSPSAQHTGLCNVNVSESPTASRVTLAAAK